ncbi:MAG: DNA polymerase III subunit delta [Clostridiales bacterium]|nr:DNA polymerase III subunit delta [Clostridiales bacterium]
MAVLKSKELADLIRYGKDLRNILIYGEEEFLVGQFMGIVKKHYLSEGAETMDYVKIDCEGNTMDVEQVRANIELPPWMSSKRIVYVKNANIFGKSDNKDEKKDGKQDAYFEDVISLVNDIPDTGILIISTLKIDNRKKALVKAFTDNGVIAEFSFQDEERLLSHISKVLGKSGLKTDTETEESIISRCNKSLRLINGELNKIILYCNGSGLDEVTMDIVEELCPPDIQGTVFKITDAIGYKNTKDALMYTDNLIRMKEPLPMIRVMIARHLKMLICAKELGRKDEIMKRLKVRDFVADKLIRQCPKFTMDKLIKLYIGFYETDADIKKGLADERLALETLIVRACS